MMYCCCCCCCCSFFLFFSKMSNISLPTLRVYVYTKTLERMSHTNRTQRQAKEQDRQAIMQASPHVLSISTGAPEDCQRPCQCVAAGSFPSMDAAVHVKTNSYDKQSAASLNRGHACVRSCPCASFYIHFMV